MSETPAPTPAAPATFSTVPAAVPATTATAHPAPPANVPQFAPQKHPVLFAVHGKKHLVSKLKELIDADANLQDPYKAVLHHELSFVETEAAEVNLHVVKHPNGDVSFQGHIKRIPLG
jgi:hypothetical protein